MRESTLVLLILVGTILFTGIILGATPYLTRKNIQFGIMLPEAVGKSERVKQWKKQYFIWTVLISILATIPLLVGLIMDKTEDELIHYLAMIGAVLVMMVVILNVTLYFKFYRKAKKLKEQDSASNQRKAEARVMVSTKFRTEKMAISNGIFAAMGMFIIVATGLAPIVLSRQIGAYVPKHWHAGDATEFVSATVGTFVIAPLIQLLVLGILMFTNYTFMVTKQLISPKNAVRSLEQNRRYRLAMSKSIVSIGIGLLLVLAMPQFMMIFNVQSSPLYMAIGLGYMLFTMVITFYTAIKYGQGGERYTPPVHQAGLKPKAGEMLDDDAYWKWGMIYVNPQDPAIFVEKRFGIGTTINFGRWQAWAITGVLVIITVVILVVSMLLSGEG
ncbi:MAG: DUF5808 domain-containing protein [Defluviitaleaceae bacterium]|nr:DUF5808 domain-containing protein [Defluviitaleaceae bacterium]